MRPSQQRYPFEGFTTWLVDFMHGAQRVCRSCRQARPLKTGPAEERYAQSLNFAGKCIHRLAE
jgi:hypothetical protein